MTSVVTDIVDVYVFRRLNARVQFLLLQRRNDVPMAQTWQAFHQEIPTGARAWDAAQNAVGILAGLTIDRFYSADFINQFYDEARDAVVLAPVLAVTIEDQSAVELAEEFQDAGWFDRDEATARLPFSGQRWAVRHIDEIMSIGETESEIYRFQPEASGEDSVLPSPDSTADPESLTTSESDDNDGLEPAAEVHHYRGPESDPDHPSTDDSETHRDKADAS